MNTLKSRLLIFSPLLLLVIAVSAWIYHAVTEQEPVWMGMIEVTQIDVASKIPGRIDSMMVQEGAEVKKGQLLAILGSREIDAKVEQARALRAAAAAKYQMALTGARPEEKQIAEKMYQTGLVQLDLAEKTFNRMDRVFQDSVISKQEHDQIRHQMEAAREQADAARARYEMVLNGARREEVAAAHALLQQAENGLLEALSYQSENRVLAPQDGQICKCYLDEGELAASGFPLFALLDLKNCWVILQLREDQLAHIAMNQTLYGTVPALGMERVAFTVTSIAAMADFAVWKATQQKGDFDLKTFEVQLRPNQPITGLRPGMTVRFQQ